MTHQISKTLELSTGNVPQTTASMFDNPETIPSGAKQPYMDCEYGWLFTVPEKGDMNAVNDVACPAFTACVEYAQAKGCDLIIFDNCNAFIDDLEIFDW